MKRWKRTVNHYTKKNAEGAVIGWIIRIDGRDIPVSKEVYQAYAQGNRKERYMFDERPALTVLPWKARRGRGARGLCWSALHTELPGNHSKAGGGIGLGEEESDAAPCTPFPDG